MNSFKYLKEPQGDDQSIFILSLYFGVFLSFLLACLDKLS